MIENPLDRPVWASLATTQAQLSEGGALARRYRPSVNLFASARDDGADALAAFADLLKPGEKAFILQVPNIVIPPGLHVDQRARGVQMTAAKSFADFVPSTDIVDLGDEDAAEMQALAALTRPGPFLPKTHLMGRFRGVRIDGRLAAMAGERMRFPGYAEVSGVCTHPEFAGRGLAKALSSAVAAAIEGRGDLPFLHAWKTNTPAITLYEKLGFRWRADVDVAIVSKPV